jgi:hypothetical protein
VTFTDDDVDRLLRQMPAPGVPTRTRERHLELLRAAMTEDDVATGEPPRHPDATVVPIDRPRRRRRMVVAVVAAAAVAVGATAAATIAWQRAGNRTEVRCFPKVVTDYDNPIYGDAMQVDTDSAGAAVQICGSLWSQGFLVSTYPYAANGSPTTQPVPPLVACVLPNDEVGVFPTTQTCEQLGLPRSSG